MNEAVDTTAPVMCRWASMEDNVTLPTAFSVGLSVCQSLLFWQLRVVIALLLLPNP